MKNINCFEFRFVFITQFQELVIVSGMGHGLRRTWVGFGMILGPLWGGGTFNLPFLLFSVPLAVTALFTVVFSIF